MNKQTLLSLILSILVILEFAFKFFIMDFIPVINFMITLPIDIAFIVIFIINIVFLVKNIKTKPKEAILRLGMNILAIILVHFSYSTDFERNLNFSMNFNGRQKVIRMIKSGVINGEGTINLPSKYRRLAKEGKIEIERKGNKLFVKFITYYTFPGEFEGLIYSSVDKIPSKTLFFLKGSNLEYSKKAPKWFWFSHD